MEPGKESIAELLSFVGLKPADGGLTEDDVQELSSKFRSLIDRIDDLENIRDQLQEENEFLSNALAEAQESLTP